MRRPRAEFSASNVWPFPAKKIQTQSGTNELKNLAPIWGLKTEVEGDAVEITAIGYVPIEVASSKIESFVKPTHVNETSADLSCFLKAVKRGKAKVLLTPVEIEANGDTNPRRYPTRTVNINVLGDLPVSKIIPPVQVRRSYPYDKLPQGQQNHRVYARPDDLIQIHIPNTIIPRDKIRGVRVEIEGEAAAKVAVVIPEDSERKDDPSKPLEDEYSKDIRCLLKAIKPGDARVKITPIDKEGKEMASGTVVVAVDQRLKE